MRLYEISAKLQSLWASAEQLAEQNQGEIPLATSLLLDELELAKEEKVINVARVIKNIEAEEEAIDNEIRQLKAKKRTAESKIDYLKGYLASNLEPGIRISDGVHTVSWKKNPPKVVIPDDTKVPDQFCRFTREVSKSELQEFLKGGGECDFAQLVQESTIQIK